jgi:hypothetical protein
MSAFSSTAPLRKGVTSAVKEPSNFNMLCYALFMATDTAY